MSKLNQKRATTLQQNLHLTQIRELALAEIVYFLLPKKEAHDIITHVFSALEKNGVLKQDLRLTIKDALTEWDLQQDKVL